MKVYIFKKIIMWLFERFFLAQTLKYNWLNLLIFHTKLKSYYKLREWKVKTLTRNWRDHKMTGTHKHMETVSKYFDGHGRPSQSEESKCMWAHDKDDVTRVFERCHQGLREEWMEGNLKGDYLRLINIYQN